MKTTPFGELEVFDAHAHFFSHRFFEALTAQSPALSGAWNPIARIAETTGWTMPPADPAALGAAWVDELDRYGVDRILLMASVPGDEESVAAAVAANGFLHRHRRGITALAKLSVRTAAVRSPNDAEVRCVRNRVPVVDKIRCSRVGGESDWFVQGAYLGSNAACGIELEDLV